MYHRDRHIDRRSNYVNGQQIVGRFLGGLENLITLSQALTSNTSIKKRGPPRVNIRLSLQKCKGGQLVFCPHAADGQTARTELQKFFFYE